MSSNNLRSFEKFNEFLETQAYFRSNGRLQVSGFNNVYSFTKRKAATEVSTNLVSDDGEADHLEKKQLQMLNFDFRRICEKMPVAKSMFVIWLSSGCRNNESNETLMEQITVFHFLSLGIIFRDNYQPIAVY